MNLTDRAVTVFGQIAVAAGKYECAMGVPPRYVVMPAAAAETISQYLKSSDAAVNYVNRPSTTRGVCKLLMVSGLEVHVSRDGGPISVC